MLPKGLSHKGRSDAPDGETGPDAFKHLIKDEIGTPADGAPLGALLTAQAMATPATPALTIDGETRDYATVDAAANRRTRALANAGVTRGDTVLIALPNDFAYFETSFALWKIGAVPCAVSAQLTPVEFGAIARLAAPKKPHFSFARGPHICVGQHLARVEMTRALHAVIDRMPGLRFDPEAERPQIRGSMMRVPRHLHVRFEPR